MKGGEWKVPVPGLSWYTETPERRLTLLNNERPEPREGPRHKERWCYSSPTVSSLNVTTPSALRSGRTRRDGRALGHRHRSAGRRTLARGFVLLNPDGPEM